jgi:hypothetical protein
MDGGARAEALRDGRAWEAFCDALKAAGALVLAPDAPAGDVDRAEGFRLLTRLARLGLKTALEYGDPAAPQLIPYMGDSQKFGIDNPDQDYLWARISGRHRYRLSGTRGSVGYLGIGVYAGSAARGDGRTVAHVHAEDLQIGPAGRLEVTLSAESAPGNWIRLDPDASTLIVRQTFQDRASEQPARLALECLDREGPPPPLSPERLARGLERAALQVSGSVAFVKALANRWRETPNVLHPSDRALASRSFGDPDLYYCGGYWRVGPGEALVIDFVPPRCRWWGFLLCNYWTESLEYRYRPVALNGHRARRRADGSVRIAIAAEDPGLADVNWLDTEGHGEGTMCLRWLLAETTPVPTPRLVRLADFSKGSGIRL